MFTDEGKKHHYVTPPTIKPIRVSLPTLPSLKKIPSTPQAIARRDRYHYRHSVSNETAEPASQMVEPFIGDSNGIVHYNYVDEFSLFIDQMINDPSA